jgi:hypothetical protein
MTYGLEDPTLKPFREAFLEACQETQGLQEAPGQYRYRLLRDQSTRDGGPSTEQVNERNAYAGRTGVELRRNRRRLQSPGESFS